jgi:hypothetical protein
MAPSVFTVSGYECDGIRKEDNGLAKFILHLPFFQIIEDALALQKNYAGYDAQRCHLILQETPVVDESLYQIHLCLSKCRIINCV